MNVYILFNKGEVIYIGEFEHLKDKAAVYADNAIYMSNTEITNFDLLENLIHELAHSLEESYAQFIYEDDLVREFRGKRERLMHLLNAEGFKRNSAIYQEIDYNIEFDTFLADEVGYPTLLTLTMGLFASPYGATSLQEYYANGFEKYFLGDHRLVRDTSPILYKKIEEIVNDEA